MNLFKTLSLAVLLAGCAGAVDENNEPTEDAIELGTTEEALNAQCGGPNLMGVNLNGVLPGICWMNQSDTNCHFNNNMIPGSMVLGTGWTAAERTEWNSPATAAAGFFTSTFPSWMPVGEKPWKFFKSTADNGGLNGYVTVNKGTLPGQLPAGQPEFYFPNGIAVTCDSSTAWSETLAATVRQCKHWAITVDWTKIVAWAAASPTPAAARATTINNIARKLYAVSVGLGIGGGGAGAAQVTGSSVTRAQTSNQWWTPTGGDPESSWVNNYRNLQDQGSTFHCL